MDVHIAYGEQLLKRIEYLVVFPKKRALHYHYQGYSKI